MRNFVQSSLQVALFKSVIPGDVGWSPPMHGRGSPDARLRGVPGQLYTDENGQVWCKGTTTPDTGWFKVASNAGHPAVIIGSSSQTDPRGVVIAAGPAVWYGSDKSIWVKTDSANDYNNWHLLLEFGLSVGGSSYYSGENNSNENMEA